jgi:hypothetical protein
MLVVTPRLDYRPSRQAGGGGSVHAESAQETSRVAGPGFK